MPRDPLTRPGTTTDAVIDIFVDRVGKDEIRRKWAAGAYGTPAPDAKHMAGWLKLRGF